MKKQELIVILVLGCLLAIPWLFVHEIEVSGDTTIRKEIVGPYHQTWNDGMGTTLHAYYITPDVAEQDERWAEWVTLAEDSTLFWVTIEMWKGPNFLMVDLDPERMWLRDDQDREYRSLNQEMAGASQNEELRSLLTAYDFTMFNDAFPGGGSLALKEPVKDGVFLFEPVAPETESVTLHLHYSMSGQKARPIDFEFER